MNPSSFSNRDPFPGAGLAREATVVATMRATAAAWMVKEMMRVVEAAEDPSLINSCNRESEETDTRGRSSFGYP